MSQLCRLTRQSHSVLLIWDYFLQIVLSPDYHAPWIWQLWLTFLMIISDVIIRWLSPDSFHLHVLQIFQCIWYICGEPQSSMVASLVSRLPYTTTKTCGNLGEHSWSIDVVIMWLSPDSLHLIVPQIHVCYFRGESRSLDDGSRLVSRTLHSPCYSLLLNFDMPFWNIQKACDQINKLSNLIGYYKAVIINITEGGMLAKEWQGRGGQCSDYINYIYCTCMY